MADFLTIQMRYGILLERDLVCAPSWTKQCHPCPGVAQKCSLFEINISPPVFLLFFFFFPAPDNKICEASGRCNQVTADFEWF